MIIDTRPSGQSRFPDLTENIPLYDIEHLPHEIELSGFDCLIFQSPNAVKNFSAISKISSEKIVAMGVGTKAELSKHNVSSLVPQDFSSEGVIKMMELIPSSSVLIIKGEKGLSKIADELKTTIANVEQINSYKRRLFSDYSNLIEKFSSSEAIIFTSNLAVEIYFKEIYSKSSGAKLFAISERIAKKIRSFGCETTVIDYFAEDLVKQLRIT